MSAYNKNSKSSLRSIRMTPLTKVTQNHAESDKNLMHFNMNYAVKNSDFVPFLNERDTLGRLILKNNEALDDFQQLDLNNIHIQDLMKSTRKSSKEQIKSSRNS